MQEKTPTGSVKWVKQEIVASLAQVAKQIEADANLGDAITLLFEVRGTLLALPLPAAALVAEEIQRACEVLSNPRAVYQDQIREALGLALTQLPDYLERVGAGEPENPIVLLAAINDLRHCRGAAPMNAAELLVPASVLAQTEGLSPELLNALVRLAHKVRPHFHRYLLQWFSGDIAQEGLLGLARLFNQLRRYFKQGTVHELFLAAEGVIQGLVDELITADAPTKALIGRIDKVLKPLTAASPEWPEELASALISDLLSKMAQMPAGSPVVQELERLYGRRLTEDSELDSLSIEADTAPMIEALRHELRALAGPLFEHPSKDTADRNQIATVPRQLDRLADSFAALGQEAIARRMQNCAEALLDVTRHGEPESERLDDIVRALRQVDEELEALAELTAPPSSEPRLPRPRARNLNAATLRESRLELATLRATLGHGPIPKAQSSRLTAAAEAVAGVADVLQGVGEAEPARLLDMLLKQLHTRYLDTGQVPGEAGVELICRVLAAIDIHLEDRLERDETDGHMLAEANYAIDRLSSLLPAGELLDDDSEASESASWSEVSQTVNMEFLNLFLEEAQDELDNILTQHERWSIDTQDDVALSTLRRAFQTLKNSGGLVGARHLADLSRVTGNLLDRLLDREITVDATLRGYLTDVVTLLPSIIDAEAERRKPATAELMRRGKTLLETRAAAPPAPAPSAAHNVVALQQRPTDGAGQIANGPVEAPIQPDNRESANTTAALQGLPEGAGEAAQASTEASMANAAPTSTPSAPDAWLDGIAKLSDEINACNAEVQRRNIRLGLRLAQIRNPIEGASTRIDLLYQPYAAGAIADGSTARYQASSGPSDERRGLEQAAALLGEADGIVAAITGLQAENATLLRQQARSAKKLREGLMRGAPSGDIVQDAQPPDQVGPVRPETRPSILLLNHSTAIRRIAQQLRGRGQMEVLSAADGIDLQAMLQQRTPELLLLDWDNADMKGLEFTRQLRADEKSKHLPIIMLAAANGNTAQAEALAAGVDRLVARPFSEDALLAEIEAVLIGPIE